MLLPGFRLASVSRFSKPVRLMLLESTARPWPSLIAIDTTSRWSASSTPSLFRSVKGFSIWNETPSPSMSVGVLLFWGATTLTTSAGLLPEVLPAASWKRYWMFQLPIGRLDSGISVLVASWYRLGTSRPSTTNTTRASWKSGRCTSRLKMPTGVGLGPMIWAACVGAGGASVSKA